MSRTHLHHHHHGDHDHHHEHHHHDNHHGPGHNHGHDHMHSHVATDPKKERLDRLQALATTFIDGFRKAEDKPAFLELAGVPTSRPGADGLKMHLVDAKTETKWQLGTASPAFGSRDLAYLPYPAAMVQERETMTFTYVSLTERADIDLIDLLDQSVQPTSKETP